MLVSCEQAHGGKAGMLQAESCADGHLVRRDNRCWVEDQQAGRPAGGHQALQGGGNEEGAGRWSDAGQG